LLQQKLLDKTEFTVLDTKNKKVDSTYFRFQQNLGRLLSPYTPYDRMLVYYDVGVGKTCSAILVHELNKQIERGEFRPTIVITSGPSLEQNFKEQFIRKCPNIAKEFTFANFTDELGIKRKVRQNFRFRRYGEFSTFINGKKKGNKIIQRPKTDDFIKRVFSNRRFILDEGHVLKNKGQRYNALMRVFDVAENITVLILTGTPLTEHPSEAVTQINLLKKKGERMKISDPAFIRKYYNGLEFREDKEDELLDFYKGMTTYLKQTAAIGVPEFQESFDYPNTFQDFKTYNVEMGDFQRRVYLKSLQEKKVYKKRDKKVKGNILGLFLTDDKGKKLEVVSKPGGAFDKLALATSIFVFPDGTYGPDGFKKHMEVKNKRLRFKNKKIQKEVIDNLEKYSVVFSSAIDILEEEPDRVFYVHFDTLNELHLFGLILELKLKYRYWDGKASRFGCNKERPAYTKITQEQTKSKEELQKLLDQIGRKENADSSCIKVVLGSPVSGIGLTIPTATVTMVIGSQVSPADITQIPNRINRPGSLKWVREAGLPTDAMTFLFAAITGTKHKSIDLHIYTLAQNKIILNKPQYELLKRADPFCSVSYGRNVTSKKDNYTCAFNLAPDKDKRIWTYEREEDDKTDLLYWKNTEINALKNEMIEKVKQFGTVNVVDFLEDNDPMIVYRAVKEISKERIEVETTLGEKGAVFIEGDLLFVDPTVSGDPNSAFYIQSQTFPADVSLYELMSRDFMEDDYEIIEDIVAGKNIEENFLKLSKYSQNFLWEEAWKRKDSSEIMEKIASLKPVYVVDGETYNVVWAEPVAYERANAVVPIENPMKIRVFKERGAQGNDWVYYGTRDLGSLYPTLEEEDIDEYRERKERINRYKNQYKDLAKRINEVAVQEIQTFGEDNQYGFYGFIDPKNDKFKIVITGGRNRGKQCTSFTKVDHMNMFKKLGIFDKIYTDTFSDSKIKKVQEAIKKGIPKSEIKDKLVTVKKFDVPDNFTHKDTVAAIHILLPGGIPEAKRCEMLQEAFRKEGIMKEI